MIDHLLQVMEAGFGCLALAMFILAMVTQLVIYAGTGPARRRANQLLLEHLDDVSKWTWQRGRIYVTSQYGRRYMITRSRVNNVRQLDRNNNVIGLFCGGPRGVPFGDYILAQILSLKYDESNFRYYAHERTAGVAQR